MRFAYADPVDRDSLVPRHRRGPQGREKPDGRNRRVCSCTIARTSIDVKFGTARRAPIVTIFPIIKIEPIMSGVAARLPEIGMACHGRDAERAVASARSTVGIWARALAKDGTLELTLARLGIAWEPSSRGIVIKPVVASVTTEPAEGEP